MAVPKKRTSVSRKGLRHAGQTHKLSARNVMKCPNCGDITLPLHACPSCGTYKTKEVFKIRERKSEGQEASSKNDSNKSN